MLCWTGGLQAEYKKGKSPRNQVPRKVWRSEEGFGLIPPLNVLIWHIKVPLTVDFEKASKYEIKYVSQKITHFKYEEDSQ